MKFKVGDRVGLNLATEFYDDSEYCKKVKFYYRQYGDGPSYGTITFLDKSKAMVQWDHYALFNDSDLVDIKHLLSEKDMEQHFLDLEKEFNKMSKELHHKMIEAGKLIEEADKIAREHGSPLAHVYSAIEPLYDAMDNAGWHTSSFGC